MTTKQFPTTRFFRGLNNVTDPQRLGLEWQVRADNIDITQTGAMQLMAGWTLAAGGTNITGAYGTKDLKRLYVVDNGYLLQFNSDLSATLTLASGLSLVLPMYFEEVNGLVYFTDGVDYGVALDGSSTAWGIPRPASPAVMVNNSGSLAPGLYQFVCTLVDVNGMESANSVPVTALVTGQDNSRIFVVDIPQVDGYTTNLYCAPANTAVYYLVQTNCGTSYTLDAGQEMGRELPFWNTAQPRGNIPAFYKGRMYCAEWFPPQDASAIWYSLPLHYHHFDLSGNALAVPGQVRMLVGLEKGLIIGTDRQIWAFDGTNLTELAPYGVVPGWHASKLKFSESETQVYFWSLRGLCRAFPFSNLTETTVSVPPGVSAGGAVVEREGMRRYIVALHEGGEAYNQRTS